MITFKVKHHKVFIEGADKEELALLKKTLKVYSPVFHPAPGAPPFTLINLYYKEDQSFPTGYLSKVKEKLEKLNVSYEIKDLRSYPSPKLKLQASKDQENLWEHQEEALDCIKKEPVGTISAATGSGKSRLIEETILFRQVKTLIIVPTTSIQIQLYNQLIKVFGKKQVSFKIPKKQTDNMSIQEKSNFNNNFNKIGGKVRDLYENKNQEDEKKRLGSSYEPLVGTKYDGTIKRTGSSYASEFYANQNEDPELTYQKKKGLDKNQKFSKWGKKKIINKPYIRKTPKNIDGADITIICFQSLPEASLHFLKSIECVIIDECHHSSAITIRDALDLMESAAYRYGFSATPWRDKSDDQKLLLAALGEKIIYDITGMEAVARGIIAKPKLEVIISPTPDEWLKDYTNWRMIVDKGIVGNTTRNKSIVKKALDLYENNHNVFICVDEIAHLEILKKRLKDEGVDALIIHGQQSETINQQNIKTVGNTQGGIISLGTMAVGEGTNMPNISAIILAGAGKASVRFLQRIGRGTRLVNGKTEVIVIDFEDWFNPTLFKHSKIRQKIFKKYFS